MKPQLSCDLELFIGKAKERTTWHFLDSSTREIPKTLSWIKTCKELHQQLGAPRDQGLDLANCGKVVGITA